MLVFNLAITVFSMSISSNIFSSTYIRLKNFFRGKQRPLFKECGYMLHLDGLHIDLLCYLGRDAALLGSPRRLSGKEYTCNTGNLGLIPGLGTSPVEENGNPLQYCCLGNPMDREAWWATITGSQRVRHQHRHWTFTHTHNALLKISQCFRVKGYPENTKPLSQSVDDKKINSL